MLAKSYLYNTLVVLGVFMAVNILIHILEKDTRTSGKALN